MLLIRVGFAAAMFAMLGLAPAYSQEPAARKVRDDLGWFSKDAVEKANADIGRIRRDFHKDLVIETLHAPKPPKGLDVKDKQAVARFFDEWGIQQFRDQKVNGVMIIIVDEPRILRVEVGQKTEQIFPPQNRQELRDILVKHLRGEATRTNAGGPDRDGALTASTAYVLKTFQEHKRAEGPVAVHPGGQQPGGQNHDEGVRPVNYMNWIWIGLGVLIVFWLVRAVLRGLTGGGGGGYGGAPAYGGGYGGGGGFFSNMLGGMFGAAAGMWMYNNFFGGHHSSGWGDSGGAAGGYGGGAGAEPTDVGGGDPSISRGDYGDEPTGGGGGGGGGDWNDAGDMGGGGGDVGGGGGDWGGGGGGDWGGGGGGDWGGGGGGGDY